VRLKLQSMKATSISSNLDQALDWRRLRIPVPNENNRSRTSNPDAAKACANVPKPKNQITHSH
jgi:hypothetical protein